MMEESAIIVTVNAISLISLSFIVHSCLIRTYSQAPCDLVAIVGARFQRPLRNKGDGPNDAITSKARQSVFAPPLASGGQPLISSEARSVLMHVSCRGTAGGACIKLLRNGMTGSKRIMESG